MHNHQPSMTDKNKAVEAREEVPEKTFENVEGSL